MLEGFEGTHVRDAWDSYNRVATADHQLDLLHTDWGLERAEVPLPVEPRPPVKEPPAKLASAGHPLEGFLEFTARLRGLLRATAHWSYGHPNTSGRERRRVHPGVRRSLAHLVLHDRMDGDAARTSREPWSQRSMVFTILRRSGAALHDNFAENHTC